MKNFVNEAAHLRKYTSHTEQFLKMHDGRIHSPKHASTVAHGDSWFGVAPATSLN